MTCKCEENKYDYPDCHCDDKCSFCQYISGNCLACGARRSDINHRGNNCPKDIASKEELIQMYSNIWQSLDKASDKNGSNYMNIYGWKVNPPMSRKIVLPPDVEELASKLQNHLNDASALAEQIYWKLRGMEVPE